MGSPRRWNRPPAPSPLFYALPVIATASSMLLLVNVGNRIGLDAVIKVGVIAALTSVVSAALAVWTYRKGLGEPAAARRLMRLKGWPDAPAKDAGRDESAILAKAQHMLPSRRKPRIEDLSIALGRDRRGTVVRMPIDGSLIVVGPPESGKDRRVAMPMLRQWPGAAIVTSTKTELALATMDARPGPIAVFDPGGFGIPGVTMKWNPVAGCEDPGIALRRGKALINGASIEGGGNDQFWRTWAGQVLGSCLHATALDGQDIVQALRWAGTTTGWDTAALIINSAGGSEILAHELIANSKQDVRTTSGVLAHISPIMASLATGTLKDALTPGPGDSGNLTDLIAAGGTIYAVAKPESDAKLLARPWTCLLVSEAIEAMHELAQGARMDPPGLVLLNEMISVAPIPDIGELLATGRGENIAVVVIVQDESQLRTKFGTDAADAIMGAAQDRLLLSTNSSTTAREWEAMMTHAIEQRVSTSRKAGAIFADSSNAQWHSEAIIRQSEFRHIPQSVGILLPRGGEAFPLELYTAETVPRRA